MRRPPGRIRGAASAPPRGSSPAGWPCRCPRCRAPSRGRARTARVRRRRALALGSMPSEPVSIAASSLRMSPNMFSVRITSKWRGAATSFIAHESTSWCSSSTLGNSSECTRVTTSRHSRLVSSTFILSTLVTRRAGGLEGGAGDPLDLLGRCTRTGRRRGSSVRVFVAEVDAAGELAHDEHVGALDQLALERAGVEQRGDRADGAQVGVEAEALAQAEQPLLGPRRVRVGRVPLRPADGGEQDGVGAPGRRRASRRSARVPWASIEAPPNGCSLVGRGRRRRRASTSSAEASTSGPIPSPGRVTIVGMGAGSLDPEGRGI